MPRFNVNFDFNFNLNSLSDHTIKLQAGTLNSRTGLEGEGTSSGYGHGYGAVLVDMALL